MSAAVVLEDFWEYVDICGEDECWPWEGHRRARGYGQFGNLKAHRVAWELANGRPIPHGLNVCHRCDNPPCVNPAHLFVGTQRDNMQDAIAKGRFVYFEPLKGEASNLTKLTVESVREIRTLALVGDSTDGAIAARFGVSQAQVSRIAKGLTWGHLANEDGTAFVGRPKRRNGYDGRTACAKGHPYTPENTHRYMRAGSWRRQCRQCQRDWNRAHADVMNARARERYALKKANA